MKTNLRIVSDGHPSSTKVFLPDGTELRGVRAVEWSISVDKIATARIDFVNVEIEAEAEAELGEGWKKWWKGAHTRPASHDGLTGETNHKILTENER